MTLLCKVNTVTECGYSEVLHPLLQDLVLLEKHGVYVEKLGSSVKGTILYVAADNLAGHSLAVFHKCFIVDKVCRFCMASRKDIQDNEVGSGYFSLRIKQDHDRNVTFTFSHLADAFVQSDVQGREYSSYEQ